MAPTSGRGPISTYSIIILSIGSNIRDLWSAEFSLAILPAFTFEHLSWLFSAALSQYCKIFTQMCGRSHPHCILQSLESRIVHVYGRLRHLKSWSLNFLVSLKSPSDSIVHRLPVVFVLSHIMTYCADNSWHWQQCQWWQRTRTSCFSSLPLERC